PAGGVGGTRMPVGRPCRRSGRAPDAGRPAVPAAPSDPQHRSAGSSDSPSDLWILRRRGARGHGAVGHSRSLTAGGPMSRVTAAAPSPAPSRRALLLGAAAAAPLVAIGAGPASALGGFQDAAGLHRVGEWILPDPHPLPRVAPCLSLPPPRPRVSRSEPDPPPRSADSRTRPACTGWASGSTPTSARSTSGSTPGAWSPPSIPRSG